MHPHMATPSQTATESIVQPVLDGGRGFFRSEGEFGLLRKMAEAVAWTGLGLWSTQLLTWVGTFSVARLLTPADYGLIGMATVYIGLVLALTEFGIGLTVINLRELSDEQVAQINTLSIVFGVAAVLFSCIGAAPLGSFSPPPPLPTLPMCTSPPLVTP